MPIGIQEFEYHLGKQFFVNMESPDIHDADLTVKLTVNHQSELYDMTFVVTGEITLICDRCLDNMQLLVDTSYHISVKYGDRYNDDSDDLLEIPESDAYLNVAYMIYDTVALIVPMKHVHPLGKCNRQMSAMLKKHRARNVNDEDTELEEQLIDEMDYIDETPKPATDPRWDGLKGLADSGNGSSEEQKYFSSEMF